MSQRMTFNSPDEAFQYLADQITNLSTRMADLEAAELAQRSLLKWMIAIHQYQDGKTQDALATMLDSWSSKPSEGSEYTMQRIKEIQRHMREIITGGQVPPDLTVIKGGKED